MKANAGGFKNMKFSLFYSLFFILSGFILIITGLGMAILSRNLSTAIMLILTMISLALAINELILLLTKKTLIRVIVFISLITLGCIMIYVKIPLNLTSDDFIDRTINGFAVIALGATLFILGINRYKIEVS